MFGVAQQECDVVERGPPVVLTAVEGGLLPADQSISHVSEREGAQCPGQPLAAFGVQDRLSVLACGSSPMLEQLRDISPWGVWGGLFFCWFAGLLVFGRERRVTLARRSRDVRVTFARRWWFRTAGPALLRRLPLLQHTRRRLLPVLVVVHLVMVGEVVPQTDFEQPGHMSLHLGDVRQPAHLLLGDAAIGEVAGAVGEAADEQPGRQRPGLHHLGVVREVVVDLDVSQLDVLPPIT